MAEVVATMVVGPLLKIVTDKASSYLLDKYKVLKGMEEQHEVLMRKLPAILDIIADAEQAASHREGAAAWLQAIKKVAYQANEVFDEFKYEALRREAKRKGHYKKLGFHVVKLFPTHNRFVFRKRMGKKLSKIVQAIEVLVAEMNAFGFKYLQQLPLSKQWRQTGHVIFDPKNITSRSRANDNKNIVDLLVGQANNADLTIVLIVGMGGLGKTTLAQVVYNEPGIQKHFDLLLWVCVSDSFDVDYLATRIVEAAPGKKDDDAKEPPSKKKTPLLTLQDLVSGQRYLLVLDDVWTREVHKWEQLKGRLQHGGMGSAVLTTTRDEGVAEIMRTVEAYNLTALEDQYIKEIIETRAFSCFQRKEERPAMLVNMVGEIVERCSGSPLAATALGSVLCTKTSEEEWKAVLSRSSICTEENGILPILKLSYNDLPSHMKQCFAFCAIFPKDHKIDVDKLIQLWIAHGFIQENQVRLETIGKQIFNELASRSFFQDVDQVQATRWCYSRTTCKIHDLMHDVALSVMEKECALGIEERGKIESGATTEEPSHTRWLPNTARHLFLSCEEPGKMLNSSLKKSSPAIQTLLCDSPMRSSLQHLSKYSSLQALQLRLFRRSFPLRPKHLHHLRYLDLSRSGITTLPEDMSILYNLQTLNLSGCGFLGGLPRQMKYMTALRHLYTHGCPELKSMPGDLGKLTSLQTLTCFVAGNGPNCSNVGELKNLELGGQLEINHLENVTKEDAEAANLMKKDLRELTLGWTIGSDNVLEETSHKGAAGVLEKLKPRDGLHALRIQSYGGTTFPTWICMLQSIVEIHIIGCRKVQWLFSHDRDTPFTFPKLKELTLGGLVCLERWWEIDIDGMHGEEILFPWLEKLVISHCDKLMALPGHMAFPNLQSALIDRCPVLTDTAESPKLSVLSVEGHEDQLFVWVARHMTSLTSLELDNVYTTDAPSAAAAERGLRELVDVKKKWNAHHFPLEGLSVNKLQSGVIELCACFVHLQNMSIWTSSGLFHCPEKEFQGLVSLRRLTITRCNNLIGYERALSEPSGPSEMRQLLPRLEFLWIQECSRLVEVFNVPASLRTIRIKYCSKLESIYGRRLQHGESASSIHQGSSSILDVLSLSSPGARAEHLEELELRSCDGLMGAFHLPSSLKELKIRDCHGLTSLEFFSGELRSLKHLRLSNCNALSSLPDGTQAYSSLQEFQIVCCPGMKTLPTSLQQQLGSMQRKNIYAPDYYEVSADRPRPSPVLLNPKTWKYVIR